MRVVLAIAFAAIVVVPAAARADTTATLSNALAVEQLVDVILTAADEHAERCTTYVDPAYPIPQRTCIAIFRERDPFARPFVRSLPESLAAAAMFNAETRAAARRSRFGGYILDVIVSVYPAVLVRNAEIHAALTVRF